MQIPILNGIYTDIGADFRVSYPVNMVPVPVKNGISNGYLRPAEGAIKIADGLGVPRGSINWNGALYVVMGQYLVRIEDDLTTSLIGSVEDDGNHVTMTYSFDRLAIASNGKLFYYNGSTILQVTDADLGTVLSVEWVDGYFITTDGEFMVFTELSDPTSVDPLKYASSESDPDPIVAVIKYKGELCAINRYTIEAFENIGGTGVPFTRIEGSITKRGAIGHNCVCEFSETLAFLGSGKNEPPGIFITQTGSSTKISTREIDSILLTYTEAELEQSVVSSRSHEGHADLWIRLPDRTLVYDLAASTEVGEQVWHQLTSATDGFSQYRMLEPVWVYDKWIVCDVITGAYGYLSKETALQFGEIARWEFGTTIVYNESRGAIFNSLELVCLSGRSSGFDDPYVGTSYSVDGLVWSDEKPIRSGMRGDRMRRLLWLQQGHMNNWRIQRFRGDSKSMLTVARIEAAVEPLAV